MRTGLKAVKTGNTPGIVGFFCFKVDTGGLAHPFTAFASDAAFRMKKNSEKRIPGKQTQKGSDGAKGIAIDSPRPQGHQDKHGKIKGNKQE